MIFRNGWTNGEKFGFIKSSEIRNSAGLKRDIEVIDGIQNVLPSGIYQQLQSEFSTLIDAYKKSELISDLGLGIFSLSLRLFSIPLEMAMK